VTYRIAVFVVAIVLTLAPSARGESCPEPLGHWGYGQHSVAAWADDLVLAPSGSKLLVADFPVGGQPSVIGEVRLPGSVIALAVEGQVAYAATRSSHASDELLVTVDLADPTAPVPLDRLGIARAMSDVAVQGSIAYATSESEGLVLVDVSDPANLRRLATLSTVSRPQSVVVRGDFAYLGNWEGLIAVDVSNPTKPTVTSRRSIARYDAELAFSGDQLLLLSSEELIAFDLTDPARPTLLDRSQLEGSPWGFDVAGTTVYAAQYHAPGVHSMVVIDAADPTALTPIGVYDPGGRVYHVAASDGAVVLSMGDHGTQLVDVSDGTSPQYLAELPPPAAPGQIADVAVGGQLAFLADVDGRLRIVDVSDANHPTERSFLVIDEPARQVEALGDLALVLRGLEDITPLTLEVVDAAEPSQPAVVGRLQLSGPPWARLAVDGDRAYVTTSGLQVIDLTLPTEPVVVGTAPSAGGSGNALAVDGDRAYLAGGLGLCIVDVADATDPVQLGCTPAGGYGRGVAVRGDVAFVSVRSDSHEPPSTDLLRVVDISDETAPAVIGAVELWGSAGDLSIEGDLLFAEVIGRGLLVIDVSDPTQPKPVGLARVDATAVGSGDRLYAAAGPEGLDIFDTSFCPFPAPSPDFTWSPAVPTLGEDVQFTDLSPGAPTSWSWDFGDGSTSTDRHPRHAFTSPGPGRSPVALVASNANGISEWTEWVPVQSIASPLRHVSIVPAAAHGDGKSGTRWRTDLMLTSTIGDADAVLYFMRRGEDNTLRHGVRVPLPRGTTALDDVVSTVFGADDAQGAIFITSESGIWSSSRTFTLAAEGTFGQFVPPVSDDERHWARELIHLTQNDDFRTNLGIVNRLGATLEVLARLIAADGATVAETTYSVEPYGHLQVDEFIAELADEPVDDGSVVLWGGPESDFIAYASVIDATTGDPSFMLPPSRGQEPLWIPAAAHTRGRNGTVWRTDLEVCADLSADAEFRLELLESDRANLEPRSETFSLAAGRCSRYRDVVRTVFNATTTGALRIVPATGGLLASSRTYTRRPDGGTYGQTIPAALASSAAADHRSQRIHAVSHSADPGAGFRTNLGIVNASALPIEVWIDVLGPDEVRLHETTIELEPYEHRQINRVLDGLSPGGLTHASILVNSPTTDARYFAYASVVDNASGDSIFIPAR
jgi:hypothetical protein